MISPTHDFDAIFAAHDVYLLKDMRHAHNIYLRCIGTMLARDTAPKAQAHHACCFMRMVDTLVDAFADARYDDGPAMAHVDMPDSAMLRVTFDYFVLIFASRQPR